MGPYKAVALHSSPQIPSNNDKHFKFVLIETGKKKKFPWPYSNCWKYVIKRMPSRVFI